MPMAVRQKVFDLISKQLNPNGIAYVSFNTYPGWHMRGMIRDMMRYHSGRFNQAPERVRQARALLDFLAQSVKQDGPYSQLLKQELETIRHQADARHVCQLHCAVATRNCLIEKRKGVAKRPAP